MFIYKVRETNKSIGDKPMKTPMDHILDQLEWKKVQCDENSNDDIPYVTHEGIIKLPFGDELIKLKVYQLSDGNRVIDENDLNKLFGIEE